MAVCCFFGCISPFSTWYYSSSFFQTFFKRFLSFFLIFFLSSEACKRHLFSSADHLIQTWSHLWQRHCVVRAYCLLETQGWAMSRRCWCKRDFVTCVGPYYRISLKGLNTSDESRHEPKEEPSPHSVNLTAQWKGWWVYSGNLSLLSLIGFSWNHCVFIFFQKEKMFFGLPFPRINFFVAHKGLHKKVALTFCHILYLLCCLKETFNWFLTMNSSRKAPHNSNPNLHWPKL